MKHYLTRGQGRTYCFGVDDDAPLQQMYKIELARRYFPQAPTDTSARSALRYLIDRARQPAPRTPVRQGDYRDRFCTHADTLARPDGYIYLTDILHDLGYHDTSLVFTPAHIAAILHFVGPQPDANTQNPIENIL